MKAVLALIAIYVAAFVIATQGGSQNPVQASAPDTAASAKPIDPVKQTDLSSLLEFVGAKEQQQNAASESITQYRERLSASAPGASEDSTHQAFVNAAVETYQKELDQQHALQQITGIYDRHFTDDEVRGLLQFFGSPLGQKFAAESPKIAREISAVQEAAAANATRGALQTLKAQHPEFESAIAQNGHNSPAPVVLRAQTR
jgi:Uncharacterized protein conserved in bacteria (DUF2059).